MIEVIKELMFPLCRTLSSRRWESQLKATLLADITDAAALLESSDGLTIIIGIEERLLAPEGALNVDKIVLSGSDLTETSA